MVQAKNGDRVQVHYIGKLLSGEVFDSSYERGPIEFVIGEKKLIPSFENSVIGMSEGEKKSVSIASQDAYGEYRDDLVTEIEKNRLPEDLNPKVGEILQITTQNGTVINFSVVDISDDAIKLDANHPLAGKDLVFEIELVKII